ncbi:hypothetical protein D3C87_1766030 [compost metagenome]
MADGLGVLPFVREQDAQVHVQGRVGRGLQRQRPLQVGLGMGAVLEPDVAIG